MFKEWSIGDDAFAITAGTSFAPKRAVAIYVGGAGDVQITTIYGNQVTFKAVPAGQYIPVLAVSVDSSATTATNLIGIR